MSNLIRFFIVVVLSFLATSFGFAKEAGTPPVGVAQQLLQSIELSQAKHIMLPANAARYFVASEAVDEQEIETGLSQRPWQKLPTDIIHLGTSDKPVWIRFRVSNNSNEPLDRLLELRWAHLSEIDYYLLKKITGTEQPFEVKSVKSGLKRPKSAYHRDSSSYLFPIDLGPQQSAEVFMRVSTSFRLTLPLFIWDENTFEQAQKSKSIIYCLAFGVLLSMIIYNLSLYLFTRDRLFLLYSFYVSATVIFELAQSGFGNYLVWGHSDWMRQNGYSISIYLGFLAATLFYRESVGLKSERGWHLTASNILVGFWTFGLFTELLGFHFLRVLASAFTLIACMTVLVSAVQLALRGNIAARYFALAWLCMIVFTFFSILMIEGTLPHSDTSYYGQLMGFVCEMLLLSFALAHRINIMRTKMEKAQQKALSLQLAASTEREQKIKAQEQLLKLQKESTTQLEQEVKERTKALEITMENLQQVNVSLSTLSNTDPLTGVSNRHCFDQTLAKELERSLSTQRPLSLIVVDVDHFKRFNDCYGHLIGDECLKLVANALLRSVGRKNDCVARYGGEEFAIIMPETSEQQAYKVAEKIRLAIADITLLAKGERASISASLGVAGKVVAQGDSEKSLVSAADQALYEAKNGGRNRSVSACLAAQ